MGPEISDMRNAKQSVNADTVHELMLGDYFYQRYYCGQRRVFEPGMGSPSST